VHFLSARLAVCFRCLDRMRSSLGYCSRALRQRGASCNAKEGGPDRSGADFFWCLMAAQRGHGIEETADKLLKGLKSAQRPKRTRGVMTRAMRSSPRRTPQALQSGDARGAGIDVATSHGPADSLNAPLLDCTVH
jgi:hypothetical protein